MNLGDLQYGSRNDERAMEIDGSAVEEGEEEEGGKREHWRREGVVCRRRQMGRGEDTQRASEEGKRAAKWSPLSVTHFFRV